MERTHDKNLKKNLKFTWGRYVGLVETLEDVEGTWVKEEGPIDLLIK
jgi:hypothetical protein